jgi:copper chaperone CopZ
MHHDWMPVWFRHASAIGLIGLLGFGAFWRPGRKADHEHSHADSDSLQLTVTGMTCDHCKASVTEALQACTGVGEVSVDLKKGVVSVSGGDLQTDELIIAIEKAGFSVSPQTPSE